MSVAGKLCVWMCVSEGQRSVCWVLWWKESRTGYSNTVVDRLRDRQKVKRPNELVSVVFFFLVALHFFSELVDE